MLTSLMAKYPAATTQKHLPIGKTNKKWFSLAGEDNFIGIPESDLTEKELQLLQCLFKEVTPSTTSLNTTFESSQWFQFLTGEGSHDLIPTKSEKQHRIVQFSFLKEVELPLLKEALQHLVTANSTIVFLSEKSGLIVEELATSTIDEQQLESIALVLESDLFITPNFFIGQFKQVNKDFLPLFAYEKDMFEFAQQNLTKQKIHSFVSVLPFFVLKYLPKDWKEKNFDLIYKVLSEDKELTRTIKIYLENQSNTSQTAKQLYMHRNTVQYRIDKFIEKTNIDIKSFNGALVAYLACLELEMVNLPK
jgi:sugar diacid utilization regulator